MTVAQLHVLKKSCLLRLRAELKQSPDRVKRYSSGQPFELDPEKDLLRSVIEVPEQPPELRIDGGPSECDGVNAERMYQFLPDLNPLMAADERLWAALAHREFMGYTLQRWPNTASPGYIIEHWFMDGRGLAALRRNAIARLWWAAHLTRAPWEHDPELKFLQKPDPYYFTRVLMASQQVSFDILERSFGSDLRLRTCFLSALDEKFREGANKDKLVRAASVRMRLLLESQRIPSLPAKRLHEECRRLVSGVRPEEQAAAE